MHCQICLCPAPHHAVNCPVFTGEPVAGDLSFEMQRGTYFQQQPNRLGGIGALSHQALEARISYLETEVLELRARLAQLERSDGNAGPI